MDKINDCDDFEPKDLLELAKRFESPDVETRQYASKKLAKMALKAVQTEVDGKKFANLLRLDGSIEMPDQDADDVSIDDYEQIMSQLVDEKRKVEILLKTTKTGFWNWDSLTDKKTYDSECYSILGYDEDETKKFTYEIISYLTNRHDAVEKDEQWQAFINGDEKSFECDSRLIDKTGAWHMVRDKAEIINYDDDGNIISVFGTRVDIDEIKRVEKQNQKWNKLFSTSNWGIAIESTNGEKNKIGISNYNFQKMYGYSFSELKELSIIDLIDSEERQELEIKMNDPKHKSIRINSEMTHIRKDGSSLSVLADLLIEKDENGEILYSSMGVVDITELKRLQEKLKEMALKDSLTGLYSRHHLDEQSEILKNSRQYPISIINIDVDGLREVNNKYGHIAGDELLKGVGIVLKDVFRQEDCVCRAGGDEFVVLLPNINKDTAQETVERILTSLADYNNNNNNNNPLSLSIGTATAHRYTDWDTSIMDADDNMYENKRLKKKL